MLSSRPARAAALLAAISAVMAAGSPAAGASTIGEDFGAGTGGNCETPPENLTLVQTASPGNVYAAPFDGVLTSWTSNTDRWDTAKLKVVRLGSGQAFTVIGQDGPRLSDGTAHPTRIAVRQGDVLGLFFPAPLVGCQRGTRGADVTYSLGTATGDVPPGPGTFSAAPAQGLQIPVTAQVEHDADGDGYGDETQDLCPTDRTQQGVCDTFPPQTSITKGPKKRTKSKKATFAFSSSEAGSSFECSLDGAAFRACASPMTVTVKSPGRHNFLVRARDTHGNLDTTEAGWSWKVVKKKHRKHKR
jgi:hypothetical protein